MRIYVYIDPIDCLVLILSFNSIESLDFMSEHVPTLLLNVIYVSASRISSNRLRNKDGFS